MGILITSEPFFDAVLEALEDDVFESKIIKDIMGFKGVNYARGKQVLSKIKDIYQRESDSL